MIIDIPYIYSASVIPRGKRKEQDTKVLAVFAASVRELEPSAFPLAARFVENFETVRHPGTLRDIRFDGRAFYIPYCDPNTELGVPLSGVPAADMTANLQGHSGLTPFRELQNVKSESDRRAPPVPEALLEGRVESHDKAARTALLAEKAAHVVICDGLMWEKCGVPCFMVRNDWTASAHLCDSKSILDHAQTIWRGDKLDEAAELYLKGGNFEHVFGVIDIVMPEAFQTRIGATALLNSAANTVASLGNYLKSMKKEDLIMFADLRDALASCEDEVTPELADAIHSVMAANESNGDHHMATLRISHERWRRELLDDVPAPGSAPAPG